MDSSKSVPLSNNVMVDKSKISELVAQLRMSVPQEVRRAEEMLSRKDDIMSSAVSEAHQARQQFEQDFRTRLNEHELGRRAEEILREAEATARRMISQAEQEAENRRNQADAYALRTLRDLERELTTATGSVRKGIDMLAGSTLAASASPSVPSPDDFAPNSSDEKETADHGTFR
ncbi:MAG: hypothetical protein OXL37_12660 [Chloroflexota bacterium]|nr:hypothetical protein [Chloroflexota bacterium]MDE2959347.1 hypothetical protein [Chloroflexota bacterium]